jgi:tight adherence protein B
MSELPLILLGCLAGVVTLVVVLLVHGWLAQRRALFQKRLLGQEPGAEDSAMLSTQLAPDTPRGWAGRMDQAFERLIQQTGLEMDAAQALGLMCLAGVALGGALYLWRETVWLGVFGLVFGCGSVLALFWFLRTRYKRQLQDQIPDMFYLLARSLRAGLSLEQAIALAGEQGARPLADEFHRCAAHLKLGLSASAAVQISARRIQLLDFDAFASTVAMYQSTGGNLALLLDRLAAGARDRTQYRNHFLAATALGRVTAICLGFAAPLLLLAYAVFQPGFATTFFQSAAGWTTIVVIALLELAGIIWLYRLLKFDY